MALISAAETNVSGNTQANIDTQLPNHFVKAFSSNVMHLAQQKMSRLRAFARIEQVNGESKRIDRYDARDTISKGGYNEAVQYQDTPQTSRWVTPTTEYRAEMVDKFAKLRMIHDPNSELVKSFSMSMGREIDYKILAGLLNDAQSGKDGSAAVAMPDSARRVVQSAYSAVATAEEGLSFEALLIAKQYFFENESIMPDEDLIVVCTGQDIISLLDEEKLTNADYQSLKALVRGDLSGSSIMGFKFIRTELIRNSTKIPNAVTAGALTFDPENGTIGAGSGTLNAGARKVLVFTPNRAVALGIADDVITKVDVIPEYFHSHQILSTLDMGAVRLDEKEALELLIGPIT